MSTAVKIFNHIDAPKKEGVYHRLICLTGENKGKAYFLLGNRVVMGRSEATDIMISDIKSSREHAEIIKVGSSFIITDLGSQNGVIVNDLKIKQHTLSNGDKIIIGKTVYKFSKVEVKATKNLKIATNSMSNDVEESDAESPEIGKPNKKINVIILILIIGVVFFVGNDDDGGKVKTKKNTNETTGKVFDDSFSKAIKAQEKISKENKEKLNVYFHRGLREYREGNYFRAMSEFESARQWSPKDPLANAYLRKTREKLDEQIEELFSKASRDIAAINYRGAQTAFCSIIRVLNRYKTDRRYLQAKEEIGKLEEKLGLEQGDIFCIEDGEGI